MQFALDWNRAPDLRSTLRLTSRFRGAVLRDLLRLKTGLATATWGGVGRDVRESIAYMIGKDAESQPLSGNRHTEFLSWWEDGRPTRLLVWRSSRPFDADEQDAIVLAAARDVSWVADGPNAAAWNVRLVMLDRAVPAPPGFDGQAYAAWESVTPYVPPRHHLREGKERQGESIAEQVKRELLRRGLTNKVDVELIGSPFWVSVHVPRREATRRSLIGNRRGHLVRLRFDEPVIGPIRLGHSSSFGLGLFRPAATAQHARRAECSCT